MKKFIPVFVIIFFLTAFQVWASDTVFLEDFIDSVDKTTEEFNDDFDKLIADIEAAIKSEALAIEKYDNMIQSVDRVMSKIGDDSSIWKNSNILLEQFKDDKKKSEEKARTSSDQKYWKASAEDWKKKAEKLRDVRDDILTQRASISNIRLVILESKDITIDMIKRDRAQDAIEQMEKIRDQLKKINDDLKNIADRTKTIKTSGAPS
jgi:hypothetical protein